MHTWKAYERGQGQSRCSLHCREIDSEDNHAEMMGVSIASADEAKRWRAVIDEKLLSLEKNKIVFQCKMESVNIV